MSIALSRLVLLCSFAVALGAGAAHASPAAPKVPAALEAGPDDRGRSSYCFFLRYLADLLLLFPEWDPNDFDTPPAQLGPYAVEETRRTYRRSIDGCPLDVTVFRPAGVDGPRPAFVWVLGSNVQPYYHQSLHETLASWGYVVVVPDTRPLTIIPDAYYHARNAGNARVAIELARRGFLGAEVDPGRIAVGGYSIGASMATFVAARDPEVRGTVLWAPTDAPFWGGLEPEQLWPQVLTPVHFLLGELDPIAPPEEFPASLQAALVNAPVTVELIEGGTHLYFMQPTGADSPLDPVTDLTRFEQQAIAIEATRVWLDALFGIVR